MNKSLLLTLGILFSLSECLAQSHFGIEGGGLLSNVTGAADGASGTSSSVKSDLALSFQGGLWSDIKLSDYINFQPHLLWIRKGATLKAAPQSTEGNTNLRLDYLELPLNLMYRIPFEYDDLFIGGGPYAALSLNNEKNIHLAPLDAGLNVSVSYQCSFGLTFSARYSHGLVNIVDQTGSGNSQNQYAGLTLGYLFGYNTRD